MALVGGANAVTNISGAVELPGTVYAGAQGADAPNGAAAAAGAGAVTDALHIAGGDNGDGDDCGEETAAELAETLADVSDNVMAGNTPVLVHNEGGYSVGHIDTVADHLSGSSSRQRMTK